MGDRFEVVHRCRESVGCRVDALASEARVRAHSGDVVGLEQPLGVEVDRARGTIPPTSVVADLTSYLEIVPGREFAWHEFYLGLGAVCTSLMAAVWAGIWPFAFAPPIIWGTVISAAVAISAAVHVYTQRSMGIGAGEAPQVLDHGK
jgi:hypothetical protein